MQRRSTARTATEEFTDFYTSVSPLVYRALAVTLRDADTAREATDEAMARAFARWATVAGHPNPAGWVYRVGLNWSRSRWRRRRREVLADDRTLDRPVPDPGADEGGPARHALAALSLDHRSVVVCRLLLDLSTEETAAVLHIPVGTVKSRLARALTTLRPLAEEVADG